MAPISSRSTRSRRGLAGVSAMTSVVLPGMTAAAKAPGSVASTKVTSMPKRGQARLEQQLGAGVDLALGDDVVAGRAQPEHDGADGTHARGEGAGPSRRPRAGRWRPRSRRRSGCRSGCRSGPAPTWVAIRRPSSTVGVTNVVVAHRIGRQRGVVVGPTGPDGARLGVQARGRGGGGGCAGVGVGHRSPFSIWLRNGSSASPTASVSRRNASWPSGLWISTWVASPPSERTVSWMSSCWYGG